MKRLALTSICLLLGLALLTAPALGQEEILGRLDKAPKALSAETPVVTQCELGSMTAEGALRISGADIALINAGDLTGDLTKGEITRGMAEAVFAENRTLAVAEITPAELWELLEHAVSHVTVDPADEQVDMDASLFEGFCQIGGFRFQYDASAPAGERVTKIRLDSEAELDRQDDATALRLCATETMLQGGYGFPPMEYERLDLALSDALSAAIPGYTGPEQGEEPIHIIGARQNTIAALFPGEIWALGGLAFILFLLISGMKLKGWRREYDRDPDMKTPYERRRPG